jgi:hypothetical protein
VFASRLRSKLFFKASPTKQQNIENKTQVLVPRSLVSVAVVKLRTFPWRKAATITGAVTTAGLLTSAAVVTFRRRQKAATELTDASDMFPIDNFARLETILNTTDFYLPVNGSESTSVLLVFDAIDFEDSDRKEEIRKNNFNLIAVEVAKARSAGEQVFTLGAIKLPQDSLCWPNIEYCCFVDSGALHSREQ